ncbi:MAG: cytochrome P450 [Candidatus Dormibacteraeota bacterium]|nr:cytochrome P450 [Candidatus Dormibacteraeota bacterium]MBV9524479.1 cytochrome P450 [Candidatus Dormibacteraeota bacterium]
MALPQGPPLPAPLQTLLWITRPLGLMEACRERYGDVFTLRFTGLGVSQRIVFVADPEGVRAVFGGDPDLLRAGRANVALGALLGEHSLLLLDGREHLRQRKLMLPPFHGERMRAYERVMRDVTADRIARWPLDAEFALLPEMQAITLEVILRAVFGFDDAGPRDEMRTLLQQMLAMGSGAARVALLAFARIGIGGVTPWARFVAAKSAVDAALQRQIERRRAQGVEGHDDVLSMLLASRDDNGAALTDVELRDELLTLLIAGHETTATALAWAFDLLLHHPETLDRTVTAARSGDTAYLDAVSKETLRIRPVVPIVARQLRAPFSVLGHEIPAGAVVAPCIYLTQRRADVYPEPDRFHPERFLEGAPDAYGWLPFGGGVRRCLGASFAQFEMRVVLSTILSSLQLRAAQPSFEDTTRRAVTLVPRQGVRVVLETRDGAAADGAERQAVSA